MIKVILNIIKENLNSHFRQIAGLTTDIVKYPDGRNEEKLSFLLNNVVPVLINIEEEKIIRQEGGYNGSSVNGIKTNLKPPVGINMMILFVSCFSDYEDSLNFLSLLISYFQRFPVLEHNNTTELPEDAGTIKIELTTLPLTQKNEILGSLGLTYEPSVLYKIGVIVYRDHTSHQIMPEISNVEIKVSQI